ncbi:MAG: DUF3500 domain-containing protein [Phycisphaerales bacterium]|nr:DUF3500 domain-containing protein [Phycisphaerales bacterium]
MRQRANGTAMVSVMSACVAAMLVGGAIMLALVPRASTGAQMAGAASAWLKSLSPELRAKGLFDFNDAWRTDWHFIPRERKGVPLGEMNEAQRIAARNVLRSGLSAHGYLKAEQIIELELVLREMEQRAGQSGAWRDPEKYTLSIFASAGKAPGEGAWGWKFEGHHLSINFSSMSEERIATAPMFLGANPAEVRTGARAGLRVLSAEEDLARELMKSLDEAQRKAAMIAVDAPADILLVPGREPKLDKPEGLPVSRMSDDQKRMLWRLVEVYANNLTGDLANWQLERVKRAGIDAIVFAWAGGVEKGQKHYYRIHGPTFIVEYDNTQNDANHIHCAWRDTEHEFGNDPLREHVKEGHGK